MVGRTSRPSSAPLTLSGNSIRPAPTSWHYSAEHSSLVEGLKAEAPLDLQVWARRRRTAARQAMLQAKRRELKGPRIVRAAARPPPPLPPPQPPLIITRPPGRELSRREQTGLRHRDAPFRQLSVNARSALLGENLTKLTRPPSERPHPSSRTTRAQRPPRPAPPPRPPPPHGLLVPQCYEQPSSSAPAGVPPQLLGRGSRFGLVSSGSASQLHVSPADIAAAVDGGCDVNEIK